MELKVRIDGENKDNVIKSLDMDPIFIKDEYVDVKEGLELDWDNLYFVKIGDYYLTDIDYMWVMNEEDYDEYVYEIGLSPISSNAMHVEKWEIEYIKDALKRKKIIR